MIVPGVGSCLRASSRAAANLGLTRGLGEGRLGSALWSPLVWGDTMGSVGAVVARGTGGLPGEVFTWLTAALGFAGSELGFALDAFGDTDSS